MSQAPRDPADFTHQPPSPQAEPPAPRPLWKPRPKPTWPPENFSQDAFEQRRQERLEEIRLVFARVAAGLPIKEAETPSDPPLVPPASLPGTAVESSPSALAESVGEPPTLPGETPGVQAASEATTLPVGCPLRSLTASLTTYAHIGAQQEGEPDADLLHVLEERVPLPEHPDRLQTLLVTLFEGHLRMAAQRRAKHKPAAGGWKQPNRLTSSDLPQWYYPEERLLQGKPSGLVYDWLAEDVRLLVRLGRATVLAYQRRAKDERAIWKERQRGTARVLLRVCQLAEHLARLGGEWFAEVCLRRAFRDVWREQFVTRVPFPEELAPFLVAVALPAEQRAVIVPLLCVEQEAGEKVPVPFVELMQAQASEQVCLV